MSEPLKTPFKYTVVKSFRVRVPYSVVSDGQEISPHETEEEAETACMRLNHEYYKMELLGK